MSRYRLETALVRFGEQGERGTVAGCLGRCTYALLVRDRYWMGLIHLLAAFARYAGVGRRTTMGLGQARVLAERGARSEERGAGSGGRGSEGAKG